MPPLPSFREIGQQLVLIVGAVVLTQMPALALLASGGSRPLYALASLLAAAGLGGIGYAWWRRIRRVVALVQAYAEHRSLPRSDAPASGAAAEQVSASLAALDRAVRSLESEASLDPLTGILNRRTGVARLEADLARSRRGGTPFSLAVFDVDELKEINDGFGHAAGDAALRHVSNALTNTMRRGDWVARWGGDEFLLGLWSAEAVPAGAVAERVSAHIVEAPVEIGENRLRIACSAGVAQATPADDAGRLFARADAALLASKRDGRGRVSVAAPEG